MSQTGLERQIGHDFKDKSLFNKALTHRSHGSQNNERLEFLGDGVLNFIVATLLYHRFPKLPEGDLSRLRAHLVKESTLCEIAQRLQVGESLKLGEGELKTAGWKRPSVLADAFEAIIGAVFLDAGYEVAESVVARLFASLLDQVDPKAIGKDAKSMLQEHLQGRKIELPEYRVLGIEGEAHCQMFNVECLIPKLHISAKGHGSSRRIAEQEAAKLAYEQILKEKLQ